MTSAGALKLTRAILFGQPSRPGLDINDADSRIVRGAQTYAMLAHLAANVAGELWISSFAIRVNVMKYSIAGKYLIYVDKTSASFFKAATGLSNSFLYESLRRRRAGN